MFILRTWMKIIERFCAQRKLSEIAHSHSKFLFSTCDHHSNFTQNKINETTDTTGESYKVVDYVYLTSSENRNIPSSSDIGVSRSPDV